MLPGSSSALSPAPTSRSRRSRPSPPAAISSSSTPRASSGTAVSGRSESDGSIDRRTLGHITALKLNDEEAEELCGGTDEAALRTLGIPEVVLTLGLRRRAHRVG